MRDSLNREFSRFGSGNNGDAELAAAPPAPAPVSSAPPLTTSSVDEGRFPPGAVLLDRYRIIALLGKGGMGEVYRATDLTLGQAVALKFLPEGAARDERALGRFRDEVRIARQVSHPNVCRVYDIGEVEGLYFISMEYVDGEDLASLLRRIGRIPPDKALEIARKLCAGLAAAHDKGVLHRDLKPANVMLDGRGNVLITDFGLAAFSGQVAEGEIRFGTPAYMAPEQMAGKEVTIKSDIYSLGMVLYEIFTGKRAFDAPTLAEMRKLQESGTVVSPTTLAKEIDPAVERVILRCLAPDPRNRPASALAVAAALPGGDPVAAALAAGETPSPDMVAASGETEGLKPAVAMALLAGVMVTLIALPLFQAKTNLLERIPFENSPEALATKAREALSPVGLSADRGVGIASGYDGDGGYVGLAQEVRPIERPLVQPRRRPACVGSILVPGIPALLRSRLRFAGLRRPPRGNRIRRDSVKLDPEGRLLYFSAVPPEKDDKQGSAAGPGLERFVHGGRFGPRAFPASRSAMGAARRIRFAGGVDWRVPQRAEDRSARGSRGMAGEARLLPVDFTLDEALADAGTRNQRARPGEQRRFHRAPTHRPGSGCVPRAPQRQTEAQRHARGRTPGCICARG